jgi:hypothetical protein
MAIYSAVPPPPESPTPEQQQQQQPAAMLPSQTQTAIDIEAWTIQALQSLSVSPVARGTGTPLGIPLDDDLRRRTTKPSATVTVDGQTTPIPRPPSARDSQRKREMLQKGKEGSRQRRRWENGTSVLPINAPNLLPTRT